MVTRDRNINLRSYFGYFRVGDCRNPNWWGLMCAVQLSMQLGRELAPEHNRFMAGLLTTCYAIGQLIGPMLSFISTTFTGKLEPALYSAFIALCVAGGLVYRRSR